MSPETTVATAPARRRVRRSTWVVLVGCAVALASAVLVAAQSQRSSGQFDPDNPGALGTRALAEVLEDQGIRVDVARDSRALAETRPNADTVVVVTAPDQLGQSTAVDLVARTRTSTLVLLAPGHGALELLGLPREWSPTGASDVPARCDDPDLGDLSISSGNARAYPGPGCFGTDDGVLLAEPREGVLLLGAAEALTNDQITGADNAALGLRLLGRGDRVVLYSPDPTDLPPGESRALGDLLPPWLRPVLILGLAALVGLMLWRGRRFGPLAVEPMPVVVRAGEAVRGRGRLHHRSGDRAHSAEALREATRRRLAQHLRVRTDTETVVAAVAGTGLDPRAVRDTLAGPAPSDDSELTRLASDLADLTRKVVEE